ncbi:hypothetical protein ACMFMF_007571 [Clarireedia jacksonii]
MTSVDTRPCDETCHGSDILEPFESDASAGGFVHESEQTHRCCNGDSVIRDAGTGRLEDEFGRRIAFCQTDEDTGAGVDVRVCGREDDKQEHGVDEAGEDFNSGELGGDDKGAGSGVAAAREKLLVIVGDEEADEENSADEEKQNTEEGLSDRGGNVLVWVFRLTCCDTDEFSSLVRETSLDEHCPETNKFRNWIAGVNKVRSESPRVAPGVKAEISMLTCASVDADTENKETQHRDNFHKTEVKFNFTVKAHRKEIDGCNDDPEDANEDPDVELRRPVLDDKTGSSKFECVGDGP